MKGVKNYLQNDQPGIFLVVGGYHKPWRAVRTGLTQTCLIGLHVLGPEFALFNVGQSQFPIIFWLVNAIKKTHSLLLRRQMKKKLDDSSAVVVKVLFVVNNGAEPFLPDSFLVMPAVWKPLRQQYFRMHPNDQHLFIIGAVEDPDTTTLRKTLRGAPQKIMI